MSCRTTVEARGERTAGAARGFTLVECMVAVLVLALAVIGLSRLVVAHDRLVQDLEAWTDGTPVRFVDAPDDPLESVAGVPASLLEDPPAPPVAPDPGDLEVTVLSLERTLDPPTVTLQVELVDPTP